LNTPQHFFAAAQVLADELGHLLQHVSPIATINSAHRCAYFAARAALLLRGINLNEYYNESQVKDTFIKEYIESGILPKRYALLIEELHRLFVANEKGDLEELIAPGVAEKAVDNAMQILIVVSGLISQASNGP